MKFTEVQYTLKYKGKIVHQSSCDGFDIITISNDEKFRRLMWADDVLLCPYKRIKGVIISKEKG